MRVDVGLYTVQATYIQRINFDFR